MSGTSEPRDDAARVGVALGNPADRQLLSEALGSRGIGVADIAEGAAAAGGEDLLIVDAAALHRLRDRLARWRAEAYPVVLPVLLLARGEHVSPARIARELGRTVEDVLRIPTTAPELHARVANLLRLRELSRVQQEEHRTTRQILDGVSRALRTLHASNEEMLHGTSEKGLIDAVCEVIARSEGYSLAWVGFAGPETGRPSGITLRSVAGRASAYTESLAVSCDESAHGRGPAGQALATGETQVVPDIRREPSMRPWRARATAWGLRAVIAMPLQPQHGPPGVLVVYSDEPEDFGNEERQLLERLAGNLTFGIDRLRMKAERERQEAQIRELAYSDTLTGLPNRRFLLDRLEQLGRGGGEHEAAAVLFIDLDDFKLVNDALGHAAGDALLERAARRIQGTLRHSDVVARQGGDEFIVLMVDDPRQPPVDCKDDRGRLARAAEAMAARIIETLRRPFHIHGHRHHLGASIGISLFPYLATEAATVIDQADTAMYQAKQLASRTAFYAPHIGERRHERLSLEERLHRALETEEFRLHYQPIWEMRSQRIVGLEALLRWTDPEGRTVSPAKFIPVAEEIGLMDAIGDWVLSTAARQLAGWRAQGLELFVAINLSVSQLQGTRVATHIRDLTRAAGTEPGWWSLELTEEMLMREPEVVEETVHALSGYGFSMALDDFGRGYSSLSRLQSMPLRTLKIDKAFVDGLAHDEPRERIIKAIVDMAGHLSMNTVAEGVETEEQKERLAKAGCRWGQGFWLSPARPAEEIPELVARYEPRTAADRVPCEGRH